MGAALIEVTPEVASPQPHEALRVQVAERLAAHRMRREGERAPAAVKATPARPRSGRTAFADRSARIAATVAERYARSPSYRAFLAAEAQRAIDAAEATAEIAALNAEAVAHAQQQILDELDLDAQADHAHGALPGSWELHLLPELNPPLRSPSTDEVSRQPSHAKTRTRQSWVPPALQEQLTFAQPAPQIAEDPKPAPQLHSQIGLTVRLYQNAELSTRQLSVARLAPAVSREQSATTEEALALDREIAFRRAPVFEEPAGPATALPANLIEFPRLLVAPRRVRPRHAEGPLRDEEESLPGGAQLRIFEVEATQISTSAAGLESASAQWTSLWLDTPGPATAKAPDGAAAPATSDVFEPPRPQSAAVPRRLIAASVDAAAVFAGLLAFAGAFLAASQPANLHIKGSLVHKILSRPDLHIPIGIGIAAAFAAACFLYLLYQFLFFTFADATPGMRFARIALCTLGDENPTRRASRKRIAAVLVSVFSLGAGLAWALVDEDGLAWHDRISGIYQRSY